MLAFAILAVPPVRLRWLRLRAATSGAASRRSRRQLTHFPGWGAGLKGWAAALDGAWIDDRLAHHEARLRVELAHGGWRWSWSGKEVFRHIASHMMCGDHDLARGLADHQRRTGTVDQAMRDLHAALRKRSGVEPW